ncbi:HAD family hydrolase [Streptomyces sp. NPDC096205]|uniref:HAD family hydrolase n=1 Tax=Streptomyces sp. NPDC096205 TaxID=3366081 RepID=UPI00380E29CE
MTPRQAAFFDVDDTLITVTSMFRFLRYDCAAQNQPWLYDRTRDEMRALRAGGAPRADTNRVFYRAFAGRRVEEVAERGAAWFAAELRAGGLFDPAVLDVLRRHRAAGRLIVLVSGSFPACLDPVAEFVDADELLCSLPGVRDGRYTGELTTPMIGPFKAAAVRALAATRRLDLAGSWAYGDHLSDVPLLEMVGHPVAVGADPELAEHARRHDWLTLPGPTPAGAGTSGAAGRLGQRQVG